MKGVLALVVALSACAARDSSAATDLDGVWKTEGYGLVVAAAEGQLSMYEVTAVSCILTGIVPYDREAIGGELRYAVAGDRLELRDQMTVRLLANRLPELPAACANGGTPPGSDPQLVFDVFARTFAEHYASFDLFGVDWAERSEQFRAMVDAGASSDALFGILSSMTAPLNDPHIRLMAGTREFSPAKPPDWSQAAKRTLRARDFESGASTVLGNRLIAYRRLERGVGFLSIWAMEGFGTGEAGELAGATAAIDEVIAGLQHAPAIIVDVRLNTGGFDGVALLFAARFADSRRLAFTRSARDGATTTPPQEFYVTPEGARQYQGPVIVLTSRHTVSAAETFVMAMRTLPHVVILGEPTLGAHSTILSRRLPNGWTFGLSNEIWLAADGERYEARGIPPQVEVELEPARLESGSDAMLDAAQAYIASH